MEHKISFRPLEVLDLPLVCRWLNEPHMRTHYQPTPVSLEEVSASYTPRICGTVPTSCHLALLEETPVGKLQCYRSMDWPEYAQEINLTDGICIDYFIGDPAALGRGLGREMLESYVDEVAFRLYADERYCYALHDGTNQRAINCSRSAGFEFIRAVMERGTACDLYRRSRI